MTTLISADGKEKRIIRDDGTVERHKKTGEIEIPVMRLVQPAERESYIGFMTENLLFRKIA